jgi:hypothetical protein
MLGSLRLKDRNSDSDTLGHFVTPGSLRLIEIDSNELDTLVTSTDWIGSTATARLAMKRS